MAASPDNPIPQSDGPAPWLRRLDQATVAALLAVSLILMGISALSRYWQGEGLIEIDRASTTTIDFRVDLNRADWPEIALLPGVGETLARRIVDSRQSAGPFLDHRDLLRVPGVGPVTFEAIQPYLLPMPAADDVAAK
jgi:competence protein ComEA